MYHSSCHIRNRINSQFFTFNKQTLVPTVCLLASKEQSDIDVMKNTTKKKSLVARGLPPQFTGIHRVSIPCYLPGHLPKAIRWPAGPTLWYFHTGLLQWDLCCAAPQDLEASPGTKCWPTVHWDREERTHHTSSCMSLPQALQIFKAFSGLSPLSEVWWEISYPEEGFSSGAEATKLPPKRDDRTEPFL